MLKEKVDALGLSKQVIFTGQRSDIQTILAACDLYTMPSSEEPFGLVFAEAMAMKKAVIALNDGGTCEVVEDGKSGLLSPPHDIEQLVENILTLVNNPARCNQMGQYSRKRVEDYFNSRRLADDVERVYRSVLERQWGRVGSRIIENDDPIWMRVAECRLDQISRFSFHRSFDDASQRCELLESYFPDRSWVRGLPFVFVGGDLAK